MLSMLIPLKDENPTETFGWVTLTLIVLNSTMFLYEQTLGPNLERFVSHYAIIPNLITQHPLSLDTLVRISASMFLHAGWIHIIGNMLYLWIFGNNIEDVLGHGRFALFYFACGLGAALWHILSGPSSPVLSIGASGAISGVLAAYIVLYPKARVLTIIPVFFFIELIRLPAIVVIGMWIILQIVAGIESLGSQVAGVRGGIAWFSHIGGFVTGLVLILLMPRTRQPKPLPLEPADW